MIPSEWAHRAKAPKGKILVRHRGVDSMRHGLYLPPSYTAHTRTAVGVVTDIHPSCGRLDYKTGDAVLLSASGGVMIVFGLMPSEETELWAYSPRAVRFVFEDEPPKNIEDHGESHLRRQQDLRAKMPTTGELKFVEGDPQGPR